MIAQVLWAETLTSTEFAAFYEISGTVYAIVGYGLFASIQDNRILNHNF